MEQCQFYVVRSERCTSTETRFIKAVNRHLCKEHHARCGRSESEWDESAPEKATGWTMNHNRTPLRPPGQAENGAL